jgi:hypothetical protein
MDATHFEFRGMTFRSSLSAAPHFYARARVDRRDGTWYPAQVTIAVACSGREYDPDIDGPIILDSYHLALDPITPEEEAFLRPFIRLFPDLQAEARRGWAESRAKAEAERPFEQAAAERERNIARMGLAETEAMCEAEGTPLVIPRDRNPGGRCEECGYSRGHRMDCCFA